MNCKSFLLALFLSPLAVLAAQRPNFLFVLIDDMGYADLSCYGQKQIETPNIDRMARKDSLPSLRQLQSVLLRETAL
jgi:hypothetical protein